MICSCVNLDRFIMAASTPLSFKVNRQIIQHPVRSAQPAALGQAA